MGSNTEKKSWTKNKISTINQAKRLRVTTFAIAKLEDILRAHQKLFWILDVQIFFSLVVLSLSEINRMVLIIIITLYKVWQKRFHTRGTLRSIRFSYWLKSQPFIVIGWDPWINKKGNYLSCIEGKSADIDIL